MKLAHFHSLFGFLAVISFTHSAHADTPLKLGTDVVVVQGAAPAQANVKSLAIYVPAFKLDSKKSSVGCQFEEDKYSPNDGDLAVASKAVRNADGTYALSLPTKGIRGKCEYTLDSVYMDVEGQDVYESIKLQTALSIKKSNEILESVGGLGDVNDFSVVKDLYCEFTSEYGTGLCGTKDGLLLDVFYGISSEPAVYTLNVKDASERPKAY